MSYLSDALETARRLAQLGITIRSAELSQHAKNLADFHQRGGNRAMRRAAKRRRGAGSSRPPPTLGQ